MKSIYMPDESFVYEDDLAIVNKAISLISFTVFEEIDDRLEIRILGNKDKDIFTKQTEQAYKENRVLDTLDSLPVPRYKQIQHIAVINHKYGSNSELNVDIIYANCDYEVPEFVEIVINILVDTYPSRGSDRKLKIVKDLRNNNSAALGG